MKFEEALKELKIGSSLAREGWPIANWVRMYAAEGHLSGPCLLRYRNSTLFPWTIGQDDVLAVDWKVTGRYDNTDFAAELDRVARAASTEDRQQRALDTSREIAREEEAQAEKERVALEMSDLIQDIHPGEGTIEQKVDQLVEVVQHIMRRLDET